MYFLRTVDKWIFKRKLEVNMDGDISAVHVTPLIDLNAIQSLLKDYLFPQ